MYLIEVISVYHKLHKPVVFSPNILKSHKIKKWIDSWNRKEIRWHLIELMSSEKAWISIKIVNWINTKYQLKRSIMILIRKVSWLRTVRKWVKGHKVTMINDNQRNNSIYFAQFQWSLFIGRKRNPNRLRVLIYKGWLI